MGKKADALRLELYAAQTLVQELSDRIDTLEDQGALIHTLFEKIKELRAEKEHWLKCSMSTSEGETGPIDLSKVEAAI